MHEKTSWLERERTEEPEQKEMTSIFIYVYATPTRIYAGCLGKTADLLSGERNREYSASP